MAAADYDCLFKVVVVGDAGVGKSSMLLRFADDVYTESYTTTIGVDFRMKTVQHDGRRVKLIIWDTAGQERFYTITRSYYRGSQGVLVVYDVTDRESFESVSRWLQDIERYGGEDIKKLLVGNKADLARSVTREEGEELAGSLGMGFLETSACTAHNVEQAFGTLAAAMMGRLLTPKPKSLGLSDLAGTSVSTRGCSC